MLAQIKKAARVASNHHSLHVIARDVMGVTYRLGADDQHLQEAVDWIRRAHDAAGRRGVSGGFYPQDAGWLPPYPETTGYIIPSLLTFADLYGPSDCVERAVEMGDWEIEIQLPTGAVRGGVGTNDYPVVFNTGQVILGWADLYRRTQQPQYLQAARRAGDWLVQVQDEDGAWREATAHGLPRAYHSRVAWPLLELHSSSGDDRYRAAAGAHLDWVLSGRRDNGWLDRMAFTDEQPVLTHTLAYTYRGLLECARFLPDRREGLLQLVRLAMENLLLRFERRKVAPDRPPLPLSANVDDRWRFTAKYSCPTGSAQIAIVWLKLFQLDGDARFLNGALRLIDQVKAVQYRGAMHGSIRGAIPGSYPCWGRYNPFSFPNWATKFFIDALMLQEQVLEPWERTE